MVRVFPRPRGFHLDSDHWSPAPTERNGRLSIPAGWNYLRPRAGGHGRFVA
jgi:hypothetical protein